MLFSIVKAVHVMSAVLFLGFGMGSVFYRIRGYQSRDPAVLAFCDRSVVLADWIFTVPSGIALPVTGVLMVQLYHLSFATPWILVGLVGWAVAGLTWLPAAFLQIRMRRLAARARQEGSPLPPGYHRAHRIWMLLGVPSFTAAMLALWAMIAKGAAF